MGAYYFSNWWWVRSFDFAERREIILSEKKHKALSLGAYVKKRNGVPLGSNESLKNMLVNSLGAGTFAGFWRYWNPIWSYYLSRYIMRPLGTILPHWLAIIFTFAISGLLHDLAISLIKLKPIVFITPWFVLMGMVVVIFERLSVSYRGQVFFIRAFINVSIIGCCYWFSRVLFGVSS